MSTVSGRKRLDEVEVCLIPKEWAIRGGTRGGSGGVAREWHLELSS